MTKTAEMLKPTVLLLPAYTWTCDCGAFNCVEPERLELDNLEKRAAIAKAERITVDELNLSDEELDRIDLTTAPEQVRCANCEEWYPSEPFMPDVIGGT